MSNDLKPCPFCGSGNVRYKEAEHAVVCARCKARGSIAPDEEMAIRMWDDRAGELKPDSWEKLEEDASVGAQDYCANWLGIDIRKTLTSDDDRAFAKDIIRRAKKLAGIEKLEGEESE